MPLSTLKVSSWVNVDEFAHQLLQAGFDPSSPVVTKVLHTLRHGAPLGATGRSRLPTWEQNAASAINLGPRVQECIQELIIQGAYLGPLTLPEVRARFPSMKVHALGAKIKPNGKTRPIVDASKPRTEDLGAPGWLYNPAYPGSLNATILSSDFPVRLTSLTEFVQLLWKHGVGAEIVKLDLEAAYRHVPIQEEDLHLQFIAWGDRLFLETKLMFGSSSSPGSFDVFAGLFLALCVAKTKGMSHQDALRYLDDVLAVGPAGSSILADFYQTYRATASQTGVRIDQSGKREKCQAPHHTVIALGVHFDTIAWTWALDQEKGARLLNDISRATSGHLTPAERDSLTGKILHYSALVPHSRIYLPPIYDWRDTGLLSPAARTAFRWWSSGFLLAMEGSTIPFMGEQISGNALEAWSDAASPNFDHASGLGVVIPGHAWAVTIWPHWMALDPTTHSPTQTSPDGDPPRFQCNRMSMFEGLGALVALALAAPIISSRTLRIHIDNSGTVGAFRKGYSRKDRYLNSVIACTLQVAQSLGTTLVVRHVPRRSDQGSIVADDLSKAQFASLPPLFGCHSLHAARRFQLPIPQAILSWIARPTPDDLSWGPRVITDLQSLGVQHLSPLYHPH